MSLEHRVAALEAKFQIADLKAEYARLCDLGYDGDAIAALFTEDGSWVSNTYPEVRGRDEISRFMRGIGEGVFPWAVHLLTNPRIVVADDVITARGHWDLLQLATSEGDSVVALGRYQDEFRFSDGQWKFSAVRVEFTYVGNLASGWGEGSAGFLER